MTASKNKYRGAFLFFYLSAEQNRVNKTIVVQCLFFLFGILLTLPTVAENLLSVVSAETIRQQLTIDVPGKQEKIELKKLRHFYAQRDYQPVWTMSDQHPRLQDVAIAFIEGASKEGLASSDYDIESLRLLRNEYTGHARLKLELLTTQSLLALVHDLYSGRLSATSADPDWHIPQQKFDSIAFLQEAITLGNLQQALKDLAPNMPQYRSLKRLLAKLRELVSAGVLWTRIPETSSSIRPNTMHPVIPLIRQRILEAYVAYEKPEYAIATSESEFYDRELETAVKTFQQQHGLNTDGIIGRNTRRAMNTTPEEQIQRLRINLERLRWLPRKFSDRYILVNIAGFHLIAVEDNTPVLEMRIVVGRDYRSTPSFNSHISHMVLNPYWNIPNSIARKDLWPKQKKDSDYFISQGIKVFSDYRYEFELDPNMIDWDSVEKHFPYALQQAPGRLNALGTIKFMFPNPFSIYLHDTPSKSLFQRDIRTYSSGCIRLEKPLQLAEFLLKRPLGKTDVIEKINSGKTHTIHLPKRLPIYLVYLTAWSDEQGDVRFSSDIYGRDKRALTYARWLDSAHISQSSF
jgi:L,D-transpeptidase YcbB